MVQAESTLTQREKKALFYKAQKKINAIALIVQEPQSVYDNCPYGNARKRENQRSYVRAHKKPNASRQKPGAHK